MSHSRMRRIFAFCALSAALSMVPARGDDGYQRARTAGGRRGVAAVRLPSPLALVIGLLRKAGVRIDPEGTNAGVRIDPEGVAAGVRIDPEGHS